MYVRDSKGREVMAGMPDIEVGSPEKPATRTHGDGSRLAEATAVLTCLASALSALTALLVLLLHMH